jgi:uncharacterized spore protein YtfJ
VTEAGTEGEGERDLGVTTAAGSRRYPIAWELVRTEEERLPEVAVEDVPKLIKAQQDFLVDIIRELKQEVDQKLHS